MAGKIFCFRNVEAPSMEDAADIARKRAKESVSVVGVAVAQEPVKSESPLADGKAFFDEIFGRPPWRR